MLKFFYDDVIIVTSSVHRTQPWMSDIFLTINLSKLASDKQHRNEKNE